MKKVLNFAAFMAVVVTNILATIGIIGGITTKEVSDLHYSMLTPASMSFSIWSIIYIALFFIVIKQTYFNEIQISKSFGYYFIASCILNIAWIITWQYQHIVLSFFIIAMLFFSLLMILLKSDNQKMLQSAPIGLYAGWINIAMFANFGVAFSVNTPLWATFVLAIAFIQICFTSFVSKNWFYGMGASWGILGIALANRETSALLFVLGIFLALVLFVSSGIVSLANREKNCCAVK